MKRLIDIVCNLARSCFSLLRSCVTGKVDKKSTWQRMRMAVAAIVVFTVTYSLVLPAIAFDQQAASSMPGIDANAGTSAGNSDDNGMEIVVDAAQGEGASASADSASENAADNRSAASETTGNSLITSGNSDNNGLTTDNGTTDVSSAAGESKVEYSFDGGMAGNASGYGAENAGAGSDTNENNVIADVITDGGNGIGDTFTREVKVEGAPYTILVKVDSSCGISKDAVFAAEAVSEERQDYDVYREKAFESVEEKTIENNQKSSRPEKMLGLFDLTIYGADGNPMEPAAPLSVTIDFDEEIKENETDDIYAVHFPGTALQPEEEKNAELAEKAIMQTDTDVIETTQEGAASVSFESNSFSIYAIVYTVDFHWEVDGKTYDFSFPGGGFVSFYDLVKELGIKADDANTEKDEIQELVDGVEQIEFSNPELVSVSKTEEDTTVGAIKDGLGLACEYSAELTEEQIADINAQKAWAGDWVLISLKPFDTEESMTVTMKNGEIWTVKVTDAQLRKSYISADDDCYEVTVTYGDDAGIPVHSTLRVTEFGNGSSEYKEAYRKVVEYKKTLDQDFSETGMGFETLDISIIDSAGKEVEPKAPVQVSIIRKSIPESIEEETFLKTAEVQHIVETEEKSFVDIVANAAQEVAGDIIISEGTAVAKFTVDHFSTYTISWNGGLIGQSIQNITTGDYIVYARDAYNGNYYALVPGTDTNRNLDSAQLTYENGVISYSGNANLNWHVTVSGSGNNRTFSMSYKSGNNTYYAYPFNANLYDGYTSNLRVRTNAYTWSNWENHIYCAGDTFLRSYNGTFQVWNQNNNNWRNMTNVFFAKVAENKSVKVHYGYMEGNAFKEFDELPAGAKESYGGPKMIGDQLNVRYDIAGKDYVTTRINDPVDGTQISPLLQTEANSAAYWKYRIQSTTTVNGGINEWQAFGSNDNDIYVIYRDTPTQKSYDTGNIKPEDLGAPAASKNFESNNDGTYDLVLGVTGKSNQAQQKTHANVVIVLDTSSSMDYTYSENPKKELGYSRLSAAQGAICDLADQLFALNSKEDPAAIELAFVNFSHRVRNELTMQTIYSGTDASTFKSMINATNGNGGTNYDTAIEAANSILWNDADPTYVVFVTDGDTVSRGYLKYNSSGDGSDHASDWDGGTYYTGDTATYGNTYLERAREAAKIQVDKVLNSGKKFYSIGVFGNVAYLKQMGGTYLGQANNKQAIEDAFSKIISEIELDLGYKDVVINDGLTALTSTTLEHGSAGNFTYYRSGGTADGGKEKYSSTANNGRGEIWNIQEGSDKEAFFLEIKDENTFYKNGSKWTDISSEQKAAYIEKYGVGSRTVIWDLGSDMLEDGVTYKVAFTIWPSQEAYDLVADLNNGTVKFDDLDDSVKAQIVENNGVYYVKTNTVATVDYTSVRTENGTVTETKTGSSTIKDPEGKMNLDTSIMTVCKEFAHLINEADPYEEIVFYLLVDGKYYNKDGTLSDTLDETKVYAINLPKDNKWEDTIYIAPGLMRGGEILETGHNYSLVEKIVSGNPYEYEFAPQTVRPMVITAVPTFLVEKDSFNTNTENKQEYTFNDTTGKYDVVTGHSDTAGTYYVAAENNGSLVGVNHKTSELDITKIINDSQNLLTDAQEAAETFTYRVTLQIPDGCDPSGIVGYEYVPRTQSNAYTLFGYQNGQSAFREDIERFSGKTYRAWNTLVYDALIEYDRVTENGRTFIRAKRDNNGNIIWKVPASNGYHTITYDMTLKQDEVIRFTNLPTGTKYSIQEIYANKYPADNVGGKTDGRTPVADESNLAAEGYEIEQVQHTGGTLSEDKSTVTGTIESPDMRYYNQYKNLMETAPDRGKIKIKKIDKEHPNTVLANATFEIHSGSNKMYLQNGKLLAQSDVERIIGKPISDSGAAADMKTAGISSSFTIGEIELSALVKDTVYELKEIEAPAGYIITTGSVYFKALKNDAGGVYLCLTDQHGNILTNEQGKTVLDNDYASVEENGLTISIKNEPGAVLPNTGGPGTNLIYLLGIMLTGLAAAGLVMKRRGLGFAK